MRRAIGVILVLLGSLLIGIGLLAKPYLYKQLAIVPLDQRTTSVSQGADMDVLYAHVVDGAPAIEKLTGVKVINTREVIGIPGVVEKAGSPTPTPSGRPRPRRRPSRTAAWST